MTKKFNMEFLKNFNKEIANMDGVGVSSQPPRYWYSTGNFTLNRIISGSFFKGVPQGRITTLAGSSGAGKAQPLNAKVLTPTGWKKMGDLYFGDKVVTPSGDVADIMAVYPQGLKEIYTIKFDDGSSTRCCEDHLWRINIVSDPLTRPIDAVYNTLQLQNHLKTSSKRVFVPVFQPIKLPEANLPIHPYVLGCLLANGKLTGKSPMTYTTDKGIIGNIRRAIKKAKDGYEIKVGWGSSTFCEITPNKYDKDDYPDVNKYVDILKELKLWEVDPAFLFIPEKYKIASVDQRYYLVKGIMDTIGRIRFDGAVRVDFNSSRLASDMQEVLRSLGSRVVKRERGLLKMEKIGTSFKTKKKYRLLIHHRYPSQLFTLWRKILKCRCINPIDRLRRYIVSVERTGFERAQCISIDHPSRLYITDDYITTHNSFVAANIVKSAQQSGAFCLVVDSENALDDEFMTKIGVDTTDGYQYAEVTTIPQVTAVVSAFLKGYKKEMGESKDAPPVLILIDSLDMLMTESELDNYDRGDMKGDMGQKNKQLKGLLRTFVQDIKNVNVTMVCTSQVYANQDPMRNGLGPWIVSEAVKYSASQIILLSKLKLKDESGGAGAYNGIRMKCEGYKTRFTQPFQTVTIEVPYESGMNPYSGLLDTALKLGVIEKKGSRYKITGSEDTWYAKNIDKYADDILVKCESFSDIRLQSNNLDEEDEAAEKHFVVEDHPDSIIDQ